MDDDDADAAHGDGYDYDYANGNSSFLRWWLLMIAIMWLSPPKQFFVLNPNHFHSLVLEILEYSLRMQYVFPLDHGKASLPSEKTIGIRELALDNGDYSVVWVRWKTLVTTPIKCSYQ